MSPLRQEKPAATLSVEHGQLVEAETAGATELRLVLSSKAAD